MIMPKEGSGLAAPSASMSARNFAVRSDRPGAGTLPGRWPFTVERIPGALHSPPADSLLLAGKDYSHFIT